MTLVLSCITPDLAVQVSDRRVTWLSGPNKGQIADDNRNKVVVVCNRLAIGYSGPAEIGPQRTDDWLLGVVSDVVPYDVNRVLRDVREGATSAFRRILDDPQGAKRHAFVVIGWAKWGGLLQPFITSISNALDDAWRWMPSADEEFRPRTVALATREIQLVATGQDLDAKERIRIERELRGCLERKTWPYGFIRVLAESIRRIYDKNPSGPVGRALLAISLPRPAISPVLIAIPVLPWFAAGTVTSLHFPADAAEGIVYGPHSTCSGIVMKDPILEGEPVSELRLGLRG
jgi:hypothetical protein